MHDAPRVHDNCFFLCARVLYVKQHQMLKITIKNPDNRQNISS